MLKRKKPQKNKHSKTNTLRIIGGDWRSRKLSFIDAEGLRPTPDRIRETLFNWLQGDIQGATCLDLFAGSGILGFEALSRGAASVTFVEKNKAVVNQLQECITLLKTQDTKLIQADALELLRTLQKGGGASTPLSRTVQDIIFLDPPYRQKLLEQSLTLLCNKENDDEKNITNTLVDKNTLIYLEHEAEESYDWSAFGLSILKEASAGQVKSFLLEVI